MRTQDLQWWYGTAQACLDGELLILSTDRETIENLRQHKQGFAKIAPMWIFPAHNAPEARYRILAFVCEAQGWGAAHEVECLPVIENGRRWEDEFVRQQRTT